jgi:hypothetical protein
LERAAGNTRFRGLAIEEALYVDLSDRPSDRASTDSRAHCPAVGALRDRSHGLSRADKICGGGLAVDIVLNRTCRALAGYLARTLAPKPSSTKQRQAATRYNGSRRGAARNAAMPCAVNGRAKR